MWHIERKQPTCWPLIEWIPPHNKSGRKICFSSQQNAKRRRKCNSWSSSLRLGRDLFTSASLNIVVSIPCCSEWSCPQFPQSPHSRQDFLVLRDWTARENSPDDECRIVFREGFLENLLNVQRVPRKSDFLFSLWVENADVQVLCSLSVFWHGFSRQRTKRFLRRRTLISRAVEPHDSSRLMKTK